jgi:hypothetical protein
VYRYIARENIDHYLGLLDDADLASAKRDVIIKLLIEEEDKLSHNLEQLEFAESRAANGRARLSNLKRIRDGIADPERAAAERLIANFEVRQQLLDGFCHHLRGKVNSR